VCWLMITIVAGLRRLIIHQGKTQVRLNSLRAQVSMTLLLRLLLRLHAAFVRRGARDSIRAKIDRPLSKPNAYPGAII